MLDLKTVGPYPPPRCAERERAAAPPEVRQSMPKQSEEKAARPKVTIIPGRGVSQTINYLLEDRDDLEWLVAVGRNQPGEIFFYDTGGGLVEGLGPLGNMKGRVTRENFGVTPG